MIRKDIIDSEVQKLNEVIARIIELKDQGNLDQALELSSQALEESYGYNNQLLEKGSIEEFESRLKGESYTAEKLNALAQLLFERAYPFQDTEECVAVICKAALVLNLLETEYHEQSLENLNRRKMIDNFLSNEQYE
jgi:hypothetical protein